MSAQGFPMAPMRPVAVGLAALLLALALGAAGLGLMVAVSPVEARYVLDPDTLVVEARMGVLDQGGRLALGPDTVARPVELAGGRRIVGTGRGDWCQGRWRYPSLGEVWQATTCGAQAVLVETGGKQWVLSPADPDGFLAAVASRQSGTWALAGAGASSGVAWVAWILLPTVALTLGVLLRALRPLRYRVEGGELFVPAHFRDVRVQLRGATYTRRGLPRWRTLRVGGTSLPGRHLGRFRSEGGSLHVAAARLDDGFLIEGGRRVFVTPEDAAAFEAALRAAGARPSGAPPSGAGGEGVTSGR